MHSILLIPTAFQFLYIYVDITNGLSNKVHCELQQVMLYLPLSSYRVNQLYITKKMEYFILKVGMPCKEH